MRRERGDQGIDYLAAIGLGNPGSEYRETRHNIGGRVIESICEEFSLTVQPGKGHYYYAKKDNLLLVRPTTYMNNSGIAIYDIVHSFSLSLEDILIISDDMDLPFGKLRLRKSGSDGGHNGLASVIYHLDSEDIPRLRIGIGRTESQDEVSWVLSAFSREEEEHLPEIIDNAAKALFLWANEDIEIAMSKIN
ncbi:aminoacyl-tRNA hydrolase [candidate division WOR-3 bacterium]|nr:aminoacyl-tRNA hydrolase [candidate division WOR-3 bacterium]MCK4528169.1 aminoacyl-tRNA hydrolase [candidate division WOR-3 bacterium]